MLLLPSKVVPRGKQWLYELKFDGFRGVALKEGKRVRLLSRNQRDLGKRFPRLLEAVAQLPCRNAVLDGEIVSLDPEGRPCFEDLQNASPARQHALFFYAFDLLHLDGRGLCGETLVVRKKRIRKLLAYAPTGVRLSDTLDADPEALVSFCQENRLEGIVAKRRDSLYEAGKRSGAWQKFKTLHTGMFIVGGFLPSSDGFSSLAVGFWRDGRFHYAAKLECYWSREKKLAVCEQFIGSIVSEPPFAQVPKRVVGDTWSAGVTAEELAEFAWVEPRAEVSVQFLEWTRSGLLRQAALAPSKSGARLIPGKS